MKTVAVETFFPDGTSKLGPPSEFECEIRDFKGEKIKSTNTIDDCYNASKMKMLRLYLYTDHIGNRDTRSTADNREATACDTRATADNREATASDTRATADNRESTASDIRATADKREATACDTRATADNREATACGTRDIADNREATACGTRDIADNREPTSCDTRATADSREATACDTQSTADNREATACDTRVTADNRETTTCDTRATADDRDWIDAGTPEVAFRGHPRHVNRLSISHPSCSSSSGPWTARLQTAALVIDSSSGSDDEYQKAIAASLVDCISEEETRKTKEEMLQQLHSAVDLTRKKNLINISRTNVIDGAIRCFRRRTFDPLAPLHVKFGGEDGIDDGGLTREFIRLLRKEISQQPIFCGDDDSKQLALDSPALEKGLYKHVGEMLAYMLVHRGPTPDFLDPFLYDVLSTGVGSVRAQIVNVGDYELRDRLEKIAASTDSSEFAEAVEPLEYIIRVSGHASLMTKPDRKCELVDALCQYLAVDNMKPAYAQFSEGLSTLGVLNAIQGNSDTMAPYFVHFHHPLTAEDIVHLYTHCDFAPVGSNRKRNEDNTVAWWRDFVLDTEEAENLPHLLAFLTGMEDIPPLGFGCEASITFRHKEDMIKTKVLDRFQYCFLFQKLQAF